jgi:hypothetical protein
MGFEFLRTFLLELLYSNIWRKVALSVSHSKSLDFLFGLQIVFPMFLIVNITEFPGGSGVEATVLCHEVTHHEAFPCPRTKTLIERGVSFHCALQPACWKDRIIVLIFAPLPVGRE